MTRAHICAQESEGRAKSESAKERMNYNIPHSRACTHPHARAFLRERTGRIAATTCACTQDGEASPRARGLAIAANRAFRRACPRNPPRLRSSGGVHASRSCVATPAAVLVFVAVGGLVGVGRGK